MPPLRPELLPESGESLVGAVGHIVSATLQTAGFFFQADILQNTGFLLSALGTILFVGSACWSIYLFVIGASPIRGALTLLGAILFLFATRTTVLTGPTRLQVGNRPSSTAAGQQMELLRKVGDPDFFGKKPEVSFLFAQVDRVVSALVQRVVSFLIDSQNAEDLLVTAREETLAKLFSTSVIENDFLELISFGVMGQCAELTNRISEKGALERELAEQRAWNQPSQQKTVVKLQEVQRRINVLRENRFQLPKSISRFVFAKGLSTVERTDALCDEVYEWTWKATIALAEEKINETSSGNDADSGVPWLRVRNDIREVLASANPELAPRILAAYIFRKTLQAGHHSQMLSTLMEHSPIQQKDYDIRFRVLPLTDGQGSLLVLSFFTGLVPYVQGLLLFLLSATFPFFALFLIIPGRMSSFMIWVSLWIWVKSWDIGFALMVSVRKLLWAMLGEKSLRLQNGQPLDDLAAAFTVLNEFDPLANIGVYYTIIAVLTMSIPLVTAQLCAGAGDMLGAFRGALDQSASRHQNRAAHGARRAYASELEQRFYRAQQEKAMEGARAYAQSPEGRAAGYSGDGLKARGMEGAWETGRVRNRYLQPQISESEDLGYFTRRSVTQSFSSTVSNQGLGAWANQKLSQTTESPGIDSVFGSGAVSQGRDALKNPNNSTGLPNPDGSGATSARDGDGG